MTPFFFLYRESGSRRDSCCAFPRVKPGTPGSPATLCDHPGTMYRNRIARFEGNFLGRDKNRFFTEVVVSSFTRIRLPYQNNSSRDRMTCP